MTTPSLREQVLTTYEAGPEAVVALVEQLVAGFAEQLEGVTARVAALEAENAALRGEIKRCGDGSGRIAATAASRRRRTGRAVPGACRRACAARAVVARAGSRGTRARA